MSNLALRISGPAVVTYKGQTFASKGDITLAQEKTTFAITSDPLGDIDQRTLENVSTLSFQPVGEWTALTVLWPAGLQTIGELTTPRRSFLPAAVNTTTEVITVTAHGFATGAAVRFFSYGTLPAGLTAGVLYFLRAASADSVTAHATRAAALAGTGAINLTDAGTGTHVWIEQEPLVIVSSEGERYTFHVAALANYPAITGTATDTLIGAVTFDLFRICGVGAAAANSLVTIDSAIYTPPAIDPASILTQGYTFSWGAAPWADLQTLDGIRWSPTFETAPISDDANGQVGKRVTGVTVTVACRPLGISPALVHARLLLQGAGAQRGATISTADACVMSGAGVRVALTRGALRTAPFTFSRGQDRVGELTWTANRLFTLGVPQPLFTVGTGA